MNKHKSENIHDAVHQNDRKLNLHEIKAQTGAGNGFKHHTAALDTVDSNRVDIADTNSTHKSEKIHAAIHEYGRKLNLHEIKAKTGAGNGFKYHIPTINDISKSTLDDITHKSEKIHKILHDSGRKLNLHEIKAKTGAGSGYKH